MKLILSTFPGALKILWRDKITLLFSCIPPLIGFLLYSWFGRWMFRNLESYGGSLIDGYIDTESGIFKGFLVLLASVLMYFLINWTFVMIVSIIASPFHDAISTRVEMYLGGTKETFSESLSQIVRNFFLMIVTEMKKIAFILAMSVFAFATSLIPVLVPLSLAASAFLISVQFLDYSWGRHSYDMNKCVKELFGSPITYILSGLIFMGLIAIPLVSLFVLPYGVIYYTIIWKEKKTTRELMAERKRVQV